MYVPLTSDYKPWAYTTFIRGFRRTYTRNGGAYIHGGREGFIPDLKKCLKASYIATLIKRPFEFDRVFKLQIV